MVACPFCAARFAATPEIEKQWYERHLSRAHGEGRVLKVAVGAAAGAAATF